MTQGVNYTNDGNSRRGEVSGYHRKPSFRDFRKGASLVDVVGLLPVDRDALSMQTPTTIGAKYGIGFEIEKTRLSRGAVREYPLFCGFERDSSCGYEAVTNILPLVGASAWRTKIYDMFHQAERIIDDQWSPSNSSCGGHVNVSVEGLTGEELMEKLRPLCGIILALYRKRLGNTYCRQNMRMLPYGAEGMFGGWGGKYNVCKVTDWGVEFRVPSRITSVKGMMRRYELMYVLVDSAVKGHTEAQARRRFTPIVRAMYDDIAKAERVIALSKKFTKFIIGGRINADIMPFVDQYGRSPDYHDRSATRLMGEVTQEHNRNPSAYGRVSLPRW